MRKVPHTWVRVLESHTQRERVCIADCAHGLRAFCPFFPFPTTYTDMDLGQPFPVEMFLRAVNIFSVGWTYTMRYRPYAWKGCGSLDIPCGSLEDFWSGHRNRPEEDLGYFCVVGEIPVVFTLFPKYDNGNVVVGARVTYGWHDGGCGFYMWRGIECALTMGVCLGNLLVSGRFGYDAGTLDLKWDEMKRVVGRDLKKGIFLFRELLPDVTRCLFEEEELVPCPPPFDFDVSPSPKRPRLIS